jgi:hypothetical protein
VIDLRSQPWWTPADAAELDLLTRELVDKTFSHRFTCEVCIAGHPPCPQIPAAIEAVIEWRDLRVLASKAAWLRVIQNWLDEECPA